MFFPLLISKTSTLLAFVFFAVFLFFYLVCSIASVLLPVSQPISGFMGSWGEISHCSTWSGSSIPWCSSCSPPSSVTWSLLRPLVCRFIISLASLLVFTYLLFIYLITYCMYNIYKLYFEITFLPHLLEVNWESVFFLLLVRIYLAYFHWKYSFVLMKKGSFSYFLAVFEWQTQFFTNVKCLVS